MRAYVRLNDGELLGLVLCRKGFPPRLRTCALPVQYCLFGGDTGGLDVFRDGKRLLGRGDRRGGGETKTGDPADYAVGVSQSIA